VGREIVRRVGTRHHPILGVGTAVLSDQQGVSLRSISVCLLLGWWMAQMALAYFRPDEFAESTDKQAVLANATNAVASGGLQNTLLIGCFGVFGAWHLLRAWPAVRKQALVPFLILLGLYVAWSAASVVWTTDLQLTLRRLVQLCLLIVGSVGIGVGVYGTSETARRDLPLHLAIAGGIAATLLWLSVLTSGATDIFDPAFSTKDLGLWTLVAHPIAFAAFAAIYLASTRRLTSWQLVLCLALLALCLFVQKVRFIGAYSTLLVAFLLVRRVSPRQIWISLVPISLVVVLGLAALAAFGTRGVDPVLNSVFEYASLEQGVDNLTGLSGRADLWAELMAYAAARPELGYGYGAFWTPDRLQQLAIALPWAPTVAHNGFLDELLATGVIGLTLSMLFWLTALGVAIRTAIVERDEFAWLVSACIAFFLLLNWGDSIMQFYFRFPFYAALVALFALLASPRRAGGAAGSAARRGLSSAASAK
jgi:exopolysaccharide production protein ExoQ